MNRKEFLKTCGFACFGLAATSVFLESCRAQKNITGNIVGSDIVFPAANFVVEKEDGKKFKKYVVVHNDQMQYPLCVFRLNENEYKAVLMKCPHQGAELQVFGDKLQCPAHGSEFNTEGTVLSPPADSNLRVFPIKVENNNIIISLK